MRTIRPPVPEWLEQFAESLARADLSPRTVTGYRSDLKAFLRWLHDARGAEVDLASLEPIELIQYRDMLVRIEGRKPATVNRRIQAIRRLCRWAKQQGILTADPSDEIKTVRSVPRHRPAGLKDREAHALLGAAGRSSHGLAPRNLALVHLVLQAGLRVAELASLKVGDIALRSRSGSVRIREGKGRKAREIPLNAAARKALRKYLEARGGPADTEPLFLAKRGSPMSIRAMQVTISELARRAKIQRIRVSPHTLRHTFALNYLRNNPGKLVELAHLLGHDSLDTTAIYTQPSMEDLARDLERSPLNYE